MAEGNWEEAAPVGGVGLRAEAGTVLQGPSVEARRSLDLIRPAVRSQH